jgi:hypothetical protein
MSVGPMRTCGTGLVWKPTLWASMGIDNGIHSGATDSYLPSRNHGIETYGSLRNQRIGYCDCFVWLQTHRQTEFWIRMKRTRSPPWPAFSSFVRERNNLQANYGPRKGQRAHMIDIHTVTVYQCP